MENTKHTQGIYLLKIKLANGSEAIKIGYSRDVNDRFTEFELKPEVILYIDNEDRALTFVNKVKALYAKYEVVKHWYPSKHSRMLGIEIWNEFGAIIPEEFYN